MARQMPTDGTPEVLAEPLGRVSSDDQEVGWPLCEPLTGRTLHRGCSQVDRRVGSQRLRVGKFPIGETPGHGLVVGRANRRRVGGRALEGVDELDHVAGAGVGQRPTDRRTRRDRPVDPDGDVLGPIADA